MRTKTPDFKNNGHLFISAHQSNDHLFDYLAFNFKQNTDGKNELLQSRKDLKKKRKKKTKDEATLPQVLLQSHKMPSE